MSKDLILGIESSCDDTAAAVVDRDGNVLSSIIASQTHIHSHWGGVYPEFASRAHALTVIPTIERALVEANVKGSDLKAIGVTRGPGLIGSLIVGVICAAPIWWSVVLNCRQSCCSSQVATRSSRAWRV
jgi:N6-L-threonylcarbamoyladenine synthase